ncbi:protein shisa-like-2A [Electrophorus electricus]|uniref:protein shisa-like-2A n=1 Tax=Electrophorus electricus TaxID=8005 RepID=UPI0015D00F2F|nr:protein shisa-like-2A [Electrophorus electricus]
MTSHCASYYSTDKAFVNAFTCPKPDGDVTAAFCCGFNDIKYCCDDPNSFFPYEYGYMWWLSVGALVGLSIAAVVLLAFIITICVLCYLFITTKPRGLDNGLSLQVSGIEQSVEEGLSQTAAPSGPRGFRKHFFRGKLDCDNQPADPERLFQRCFMATVSTTNMDGLS